MIGLRRKAFQRNKPGAERFASIGAAELPLQRIAYQRDGLADNPATDRFVETLAASTNADTPGQMPGDFCRCGRCLAALRAGIDQALMHATAAGGKECELRRIPEISPEEIDALIFASALGRAQGLTGQSDQSLRVGGVIAHRVAPAALDATRSRR